MLSLVSRGRKSGWSGKRDSNPRPPAWKAGALPLSYSREYAHATPSMPERTPVARAAMSRPSFSGHPRSDPGSPHPLQWWGGEDSNPRRHTPADLQSAPFGHLGTSPNLPACERASSKTTNTTRKRWRWREDLNPRPTAYKAVALPLSYASTDKTLR